MIGWLRAIATGRRGAPCSRRAARRLADDTRGVAAVEFALVTSLFLFAMLNAVDLAMYTFQRMAVENAAQMGAQAAWRACDLDSLPATTQCAGLNDAIERAIASTNLGNAVALQSTPSEGYYCLNDANGLDRVAEVSSKPDDCSSVGMPDEQPGDYISVTVTYTYSSMFGRLTVTRLLDPVITQMAFIRLG